MYYLFVRQTTAKLGYVLGKFNDLTGKRFGRLVVIKRAENRGGHVAWQCLCDCGNYKDVISQSLTRGVTTSCGCYNKEKNVGKPSWNYNDLTGQKFGNLTVVKRIENKGKYAVWECLCDCGNTTEVFGGNLRKGHTKSCGCLKGKLYEDDLKGMKFGRLTCIKKSDISCATGAQWYCQCECGNEVLVSRNHLITGHTQSCGCYRDDQTSLANSAKIESGTRYGRLTVIKEAYKKNLLTFWECKCDCGNTTFVPTGHLNSGHTQSCGCLASQGEFKISTLLNDNNIMFEQQKSFNNCKYDELDYRLPRFDFFVSNKYLIEFDGIQHFEPVEYFGGEEQFAIQQEHDIYKNQWCKENNIPLIRIPYTKLNTLCLKDLLLETTEFRIA